MFCFSWDDDDDDDDFVLRVEPRALHMLDKGSSELWLSQDFWLTSWTIKDHCGLNSIWCNRSADQDFYRVKRVPCLGKPDYSQGLMDILFKLSKWLNFWAFNWWKWIKEQDWQVWRSASVWSPTYFFKIDDMPIWSPTLYRRTGKKQEWETEEARFQGLEQLWFPNAAPLGTGKENRL